MPARIRLYQYAFSPFCIPIELILRHSGIPHEVVNLPVYDPSKVIQLTRGAYYQVPVLEDLASRQIIFDKSESGDDVARHLAGVTPLMNLFPEQLAGLQRVLIHYIENECEMTGFKVNDAHCDKWLKSDLERGLHRRHKERRFGPGCLEEWTRNVDKLAAKFFTAIEPFEQMLGQHPFLTGDQPVYADYVLCGVLGNFLFSGATLLPPHYLMLEAWYTKMRAGNFRNELEDAHLSSDSGPAAASKVSLALADLGDLDKVIAEIKLRPGSNVLDVPTEDGLTAAYLAEKGFTVTAADQPVSPHAIALVEKRQASVTFHEHSAEKLPYADASFSLVICRGAAHHLKAPDAFVREATRVLKTYGYLVVIDDTVPDDHVEANAWMNSLERLRDAAHVKFITPHVWRHWCAQSGLTVVRAQVDSIKQPDLQRYMEEANTPPENRKQVLELIVKAPPAVREVFKLGQEGGKIIWYRRRLTLIAAKM